MIRFLQSRPERTVLGPEGRWLGPVRMPAGFTPLQVGVSWILGLQTDELGAERVVVRSLERSGATRP